MIKRLAILTTLLLFVLVVIGFMPGPLKVEKTILIRRGSVYDIATTLEEADIIANKKLFWVVAQIMQKSLRCELKAGEYNFSANASVLGVIKKMRDGDVIIRKLTIPEGLTYREIVALVQNAEFLNGNITRIYTEGSLLPQTYFYTHGDTRDQLLGRMNDAMQIVLDQAWLRRDPSINQVIRNKSEALILASIVEEEAKLHEDRKLIAAVFLNRLKKGMRLEADPTVLYAVNLTRITQKQFLTRKDLKINSPFNTYQVRGLPPTPIANPGIKSLQAVLTPIKTDHLYFVIGNCLGKHNFASSLREHNKNVALYRKLNCNR
jgi:UPF0755 protein